MLDILIYYKNKHIGSSKFFKIYHNRICLFESNFNKNVNYDLSFGSILEIRCTVNKILCDTFEIEVQKIKERQNIICYYGFFHFFPVGFNQFVYDLLYQWRKNDFTKWETLSKSKKRLWIKACLYYSGIPNFNIKDKIVKVDFSHMKDKVDMYIILGEAIIGTRGYFGQDLHGLQDCLHEMQKYGANNFSLEINGFQNFCKIVDNTSNSFSLWFIELMKNNGVIIKTGS